MLPFGHLLFLRCHAKKLWLRRNVSFAKEMLALRLLRSTGFSQSCRNAAKFPLACDLNSPRLSPWLFKRRLTMGLTRPINALMICAAFAFIGALIMGVLP
jgi:hypothetical protein